MVNSLPIYWGNPLIHREFNTKSFVNYHDFEREIKKNIPKIFFEIPFIDWLTKKYVEKETFKRIIKIINDIQIDDLDINFEMSLKNGVLMGEHSNDCDSCNVFHYLMAFVINKHRLAVNK